MSPRNDTGIRPFNKQYKTDISRVDMPQWSIANASFLNASADQANSNRGETGNEGTPVNKSQNASSCNANNATIDERCNQEVSEMVQKHQFMCQNANFASFAPASVRSTVAPPSGSEEQKCPDTDKKIDEEIHDIKLEIVEDVKTERKETRNECRDIKTDSKQDTKQPASSQRNDDILDVEMAEEESKEDRQIQEVISVAKEKARNSVDRINISAMVPKQEEGTLDVANNYCIACKHVQVTSTLFTI